MPKWTVSSQLQEVGVDAENGVRLAHKTTIQFESRKITFELDDESDLPFVQEIIDTLNVLDDFVD